MKIPSSFRSCVGVLADTGSPKGLGVFAAQDFKAGDIVEIAPVVQIGGPYDQLDPQLQCRVFDWQRLAGREGVRALALGFGSMYNHANPANLTYAPDLDGNAIRFVAVVDIQCGVELTINYNGAGGGHVSTEDNWFERLNIAPL